MWRVGDCTGIHPVAEDVQVFCRNLGVAPGGIDPCSMSSSTREASPTFVGINGTSRFATICLWSSTLSWVRTSWSPWHSPQCLARMAPRLDGEVGHIRLLRERHLGDAKQYGDG